MRKDQIVLTRNVLDDTEAKYATFDADGSSPQVVKAITLANAEAVQVNDKRIDRKLCNVLAEYGCQDVIIGSPTESTPPGGEEIEYTGGCVGKGFYRKNTIDHTINGEVFSFFVANETGMFVSK